MKDYYALLGIDASASKADIKRNYRLLATKFHPDKSKDPSSAAKFIAITEAYDVLSNRKRRAQYDFSRWQTLKKKQETDYSFTAVVPPSIKLRVRRNEAQQQRSVKYHEAKAKPAKAVKLFMECLYIVARYAIHLIGISLLLVILKSALSQLSDIFTSGYAKGVIICIMIAVLVYGIYKISEHMISEFREDVKAFTAAYALTAGTATLLSVSVFVVIILLYAALLSAY